MKTSEHAQFQVIFICSKSAMEMFDKGVKQLEATNKNTERRHRRRSAVFIVNFEHISHLFFGGYIVKFEQVNVNQDTFKIRTHQFN